MLASCLGVNLQLQTLEWLFILSLVFQRWTPADNSNSSQPTVMSSQRDGQQISAARLSVVSVVWLKPGSDQPSDDCQDMIDLCFLWSKSEWKGFWVLWTSHWTIRSGPELVNQSYILFIGHRVGVLVITSSCLVGGFMKSKQMWFLPVELRVVDRTVSGGIHEEIARFSKHDE